VAIVGDFNEVLGQDPVLMALVCATHRLFDVHAKFHGLDADILTYARGTKRVDYCVASDSLEPHVTACGFNQFNENIHSNHRVAFVDFVLKVFFGHNTPSLEQPDMRFVSTSSPDVTKFVQKMYRHLAENKVFHQFQYFCLNVDVAAEPWRDANKIDNDIGHAFSAIEKHCSKTPKPPWSETLHHTSLKVRYWKTALTARRTGVHQDTVLRNLAVEIWSNAPTPQTPVSIRILQKIGTAAQRALRRVRRHAVKERELFLNELKARLALRMSSRATDNGMSACKSIKSDWPLCPRFRVFFSIWQS
jgi:hypothetical protein